MTEDEIRSQIQNAQSLQNLMDILNALCERDENCEIPWNDLPVFELNTEIDPLVPLSWDDTHMLVLDPTGDNGPAFVKIIERNW